MPSPDPAIEIREVAHARGARRLRPHDRRGLRAFRGPPSAEEMLLGRLVTARPRATLLLAYVDGEVAGTGRARRRATGSRGSTATRRCRRSAGAACSRRCSARGCALAVDAGCDLAVTDSTPGSGSQRNMERLGFRVAYTRVEMTHGV